MAHSSFLYLNNLLNPPFYPYFAEKSNIQIMMEENYCKENTHVVIMAGGVGSRLWPLSTPDYPKQFIDVLGVGKTLIQLTVTRFLPVCPMENFWVVTSEKYVDLVKEQLPNIPVDHILAEPAARNTAPCIAYACWKIKSQVDTANIVVTPSDALVLDTVTFADVAKKALNFTASKDAIVTIGIRPSRPETGYGYILCEEQTQIDGIAKVQAFKEKPTLEVAQQYIQNKLYNWNAGIFVWNLETIDKALRRFAPQITDIMDRMAMSFGKVNEKETTTELFPTCEKISIDYAVMEKADNIYCLPADFGWSDLGSWGSISTKIKRDEANNAVIGDNVKLYECTNCMVNLGENKVAVLQGLDGYIVAERDGRLLACKLSEEQRIKEFSSDL